MSDINSSTASNVNFRARAPLILSIALAYAVMGWAGLVLAIPPGYATPVFPAAGLALACVLWFGPTVLAGVWLGSALLNLSHPWWAGTLTVSTAVAAMVIATSAALQAWVGSWLACRRQDPAWRTLEHEKDVLLFLLLGGLLPGIISSLTGASALEAFGVIEAADFFFTAWNWYVGDVLGVLGFAPLTLCLLNREGELWRDRRQRIVMPMAFTLGLVALALHGAARWEKQAQDLQLEADSEIVFQRIADRVIAHREVLSSLKRFIEATPDFSFEQFEVFTRITLQDNPDIFALSFNDLIVDEKRAAFERMMTRLSPLGSFQITERDAAGRLIRAKPRPEYVTVRYIVPLANNQPAVGYDIYSEPVRRDAIDRARASGAMAVTAPVRLVQEDLQRVGVLELLPVTSLPAGPADNQRTRLVGFAVAVVKVDEMIDIATKGRVPAGLVFQLIDRQAPEGQGLLYHSGSPSAGNIPLARAKLWKTAVRMGDRDWEFSVDPTKEYQRLHRPWMTWAVGVAGLLFATLLQILMLGMTGRTSMQKRAKEKLEHSYDLMRYIIEHANSAVAVHDRDLRYIYVSQNYLDQYKVEERNVIGKHHYDIFPDLPQKWRDVHQRALSGEVSTADRDPYYRADGTVDWTRWECRPWYEASGAIGGIVVYTEVITEFVREEEALRESEQRLRLLTDNMVDGISQINAERTVVYCSPSIERVYGIKQADLIGHNAYERLHPEDADRLHQQGLEAIASRAPWLRTEYRYLHGRGEYVWVEASIRLLFGKDGEYAGAVIGSRDINEKKLSEQRMRESAEALKQANLVVESSPVVLFRWRAVEGWPVAMVSQNVIQFGYTPEELLSGAVPFARLVHPEDQDRVSREVQEYSAIGADRFHQEYRIVTKDGGVRWVDDRTLVERNADGQITFYQGTVLDITDRKRVEEALQALSMRQQALLAAIPDIVMEVDHRRIYTWANQAGLDFFGADVLGQEASAYFAGEQNTYDKVEPLFQGEEDVIYLESWQRRCDGQKRLLGWWCRGLKDEQGRVTGALSSARDITEAKQAEAALRESEERFSVFMSHLPASAFIKDVDGRMVFANRYLLELFGIQDYVGKTTPEIIAGEIGLQMIEDDRRALAEGVINIQETVRDSHGREHVFEVLKFPIHTVGRPAFLGGIAVDITSNKQTEAALRASLEEKTALLLEVHHRVKNNLQIISSLLNLQASQEKSQPVLAALRETQNRVRSMAMLHEMLYRSESLARVNLTAYLESLCAQLFRAFGADPNRVRLDYHTAAVELGLDQAVPCGLILNELVSNALEHAFPEGRVGRITVELRRDSDDRLALTVADDGVGLPPGLDLSQTSTLGLQLVRILTIQLKGALVMEQGQGASFKVTFPSHRPISPR